MVERARWVIGAWLVQLGLRVMDAGPWEVWTQNYGSWDSEELVGWPISSTRPTAANKRVQ